MFNCKLCNEWLYTKYICDDCKKIRDMINLYSRSTVVDVLENVLVRDTIKRNYKIKYIKKDGLNKVIEDNNSILVDTSNNEKKEEKDKIINKDINKKCLKELKRKLDDINKV